MELYHELGIFINFYQLVKSSTCYFIKWLIHQLPISTTWRSEILISSILLACHLIKLPFNPLTFDQLDIKSICYFVKRIIYQLDILPTCHFITLSFRQLVTSWTRHFINLPFHQLAIWSTFHFTFLPFCQSDI